MTEEKINNYPNRFVFNKETDLKGNKYLKAYSNKTIPCVICINGKNILAKGRLNLFKREGESKFGSEIGIYFKIENIESEYPTTSKHEVVEFYLPSDVGIEFLEQSINYFKSNKEK